MASARRFFAASSPSSIRLASSISSSGVKRSTLPISFRYIRTGSSMASPSASAEVSTSSSSGISSTLPGKSPSTSSRGWFSMRKSSSSTATSIPAFSSASKKRSCWSGSNSISSKTRVISFMASFPFFLPCSSKSCSRFLAFSISAILYPPSCSRR